MGTLSSFTSIASNFVYEPISEIAKIGGFDLDAEYSKFSDSNTSSGKLTDGLNEIDIIIKHSGGYYENWKSGMKLIVEKITK